MNKAYTKECKSIVKQFKKEIGKYKKPHILATISDIEMYRLSGNYWMSLLSSNGYGKTDKRFDGRAAAVRVSYHLLSKDSFEDWGEQFEWSWKADKRQWFKGSSEYSATIDEGSV